MPGAFFLLSGVLLFFSCAGEPPKIIIQPENSGKTSPSREEYQILNYQGAEQGNRVPEWVSRYLAGGNRGVEGLELYQGSYVFVGTNRGTNFKALNHWAESFTVDQDFPRLAAVRIEARLIGAASLYPDDEYGEFFETLVKKAADAAYTGVIAESSFWILRQYRQSDGEHAPLRDQYDFFVLSSVEKSEFQAQALAIMADIKTTSPPTRDQAAAISRIRETFFADF
jgi:hypothetical protein